MENLTSKEIKKSSDKGINTVIVIASSTEQHGPHLPLSTDEKIGEIIGKRLAKKINALVAPIIRPGCSDHHMDYPGTISLSKTTLNHILRDYCNSLAKNGFKNIIVISTHGGNCQPITSITSDLAKELEETNIIPLSDLEEHLDVWAKAAEDYGVKSTELKHAGAAETSIMLAEMEHLVDKDEIKKGFVGKVKTSNLFKNGLKKYTEAGVLGDPTKASKEMGEKLIEALVEYFLETITEEISRQEL